MADQRSAEVAEVAEKDPLLHRVGEAAARFGSRPPRRRRTRMAIQFGLALLVFGFLVLAVASQWSELKQHNVRFVAGWLVPGAAVVMCFYAYSAYGWDLVVRFLGYRIAPARAQSIWGQSLLARYVPGNVLYVVGRVMLAGREGVPRRTTLASMIYEVGLTFVSAATIGAYFFIDHPDLSGQPLRFAALGVLPIGLVVLHPRVFGPLSAALLRRFGRDPLPEVMPFGGVLAMLGYYAVGWAIMGVGVFFVARSVHAVGFTDLPIVTSAEALGFCAAVATLVFPGGLGIRDGAFAWAVKSAFGGSFAVGAAVAIAVRIVLTIVEVAYVGIVTTLGRRAGVDDHLKRDAVDQLKGGEGEHRAAQGPVAGDRRQRQDPDHVPGQ